jgi:hypothetical protein
VVEVVQVVVLEAQVVIKLDMVVILWMVRLVQDMVWVQQTKVDLILWVRLKEAV